MQKKISPLKIRESGIYNKLLYRESIYLFIIVVADDIHRR